MAKDSAYAFAAFAANLKFEDIPPQVAELVRQDVMDIIGNMLGGSSEEPIAPMLTVAREQGGGSARIAVYGDAVSPETAAMINAAMAHSLDFDDMVEPARLHAGVSVVPPLLALAQSGVEFTGAEMICALSAAMEIGTRLGMYMERRLPSEIMGGWDYASLFGYIMSAVAAAKILKLDEDGIRNAMGIAYHQAAGTSVSAMDGADTKVYGPGFAARGGMLSAKLAAAGATGASHLFDETHLSMANHYHSGCDREALTDGLGTKWELTQLGFKSYPCCRLIHRQIDAALRLRSEYGIAPEDILKVEITACPMNEEMLTRDAKNMTPSTRIDAQFSLLWTVACALVKGRLSINDFSEEGLHDPAVLEMAEKIWKDPDRMVKDIETPAAMKITTVNGVYETMAQICKGMPENPLTWEDLRGVFTDCAAHAARPVPQAVCDGVIGLCRRLETVQSVSELAAYLTWE